MIALNYGTIAETLLSELPGVRKEYESWRTEAPGESSPYAVVMFALEPYLKSSLKHGEEDAQARKAFSFLERMSCSQDLELVNLVFVGIFEAWLGEAETMRHAWRYMGHCTKEIARNAARTLNLEQNLPDSLSHD